MKSDRRLARDVARELERRARRRRLLFLMFFGALIALAVMYVRCGGGWGFGGSGNGDGTGKGSATTKPQTSKRCEIFIAKEGIKVDDKPMTRAEAVAACTKRGGADIDVAGDARHGDVEALKSALEAKKVPVFVRRGSR